MSEFEKWYKEKYPQALKQNTTDSDKYALEIWQAATAESDKRIAELESEVTKWQGIAVRHAKYEEEADAHNEELQTHIKVLREALERALEDLVPHHTKASTYKLVNEALARKDTEIEQLQAAEFQATTDLLCLHADNLKLRDGFKWLLDAIDENIASVNPYKVMEYQELLSTPPQPIAQHDKAILALQTNINVLREALECIAKTNASTHGTTQMMLTHCIKTANEALSATPAQSLQAHYDEVIERCAWECWNIRDADNIRALKHTS